MIRNTSNGKVYVGSAEDLYTRAHSHFSTLRYQKHCNPHLQNAWNLDNCVLAFEILEFVGRDLLREREQFHIDTLQASNREHGYNIHATAIRMPDDPAIRARLASCKHGRKCSEETKKKIAATLSGRKLAPFTDEHKAKISAAHVGREKTALHRQRIREARANQPKHTLSHPHTEETKRLIGDKARQRYLAKKATA